jgi:hypothetical protein
MSGSVGNVTGGIDGDPADEDQSEVIAYQPHIKAFGHLIVWF